MLKISFEYTKRYDIIIMKGIPSLKHCLTIFSNEIFHLPKSKLLSFFPLLLKKRRFFRQTTKTGKLAGSLM